jgi:hypothetical protein
MLDLQFLGLMAICFAVIAAYVRALVAMYRRDATNEERA